MERRIQLGKGVHKTIAEGGTKPTVTFVDSGKRLRIEFSIKSDPGGTDLPAGDPKLGTHRDLFEPTGGDVYGGELDVALLGIGRDATLVQVNFVANSKVPRTGFAALRAAATAKGKRKSGK